MYLGNLYPARLPPEAAWGDFRSGLVARAGDFCVCLPSLFPPPLSPNPQSSGEREETDFGISGGENRERGLHGVGGWKVGSANGI